MRLTVLVGRIFEDFALKQQVNDLFGDIDLFLDLLKS